MLTCQRVNPIYCLSTKVAMLTCQRVADALFPPVPRTPVPRTPYHVPARGGRIIFYLGSLEIPVPATMLKGNGSRHASKTQRTVVGVS